MGAAGRMIDKFPNFKTPSLFLLFLNQRRIKECEKKDGVFKIICGW